MFYWISPRRIQFGFLGRKKSSAKPRRKGRFRINPIIYAELAPAFATAADLDQWLDPAIFERLPLPYAAGWLAAQAFLKYRRSGGVKTSPLPDFYIGAHAEVGGHTLVTRDPSRYRTYFPSVRLIVPPNGKGDPH